jgi:hypothetical protein
MVSMQPQTKPTNSKCDQLWMRHRTAMPLVICRSSYTDIAQRARHQGIAPRLAMSQGL